MANLKASEDAFLSSVAKQRITTYDGKLWELYDVGDRTLTPLVCLPGTIGGPLIFHRVISALQLAGGYRVIAIQHPVVWNHQEWVHSFDRLLDALHLHSVHIYGVCLGAFLAQKYCAVYPRRVLSLALTNGFCNTKVFGANSPCIKMLPMLPTFCLKKYVVGNFSHDGTSDVVRATMAYMSSELDSLTQLQLASRLTLVSLSSDHLNWGISIPHTRVTLIDSYGGNNEFTTELREQMYERYPEAKKALMKTAGDFPYLSHDDEVILQLRVHLRSNGYKA
ncbi:hypothetical protein, variant 1 [Aphanomyces invadans]|uniref:Maspardin n=1 Tax=Aphanomyces invadans TaxID=157072 RepID=A0A024UCZ2_9STRA|nr:hypothetical protein, variant 1 [Aphanomyces invadans]ETW03473.1 hypothetical protein, variant 1 [Aphanomyces invadans]|eukprot:XP_008867702.1 hypothetical protein, variant 1 [Aphanomyces invadans]